MQIHQDNNHAGVEWVLNRLRQNFWLIRGRKSITRILHQCMVCRRFNQGYGEQQMAPLPSERLQLSMPFEHCAVDLGGPIPIRKFKQSKETRKAYIVLFTCLMSRAVHLEMVKSLTAADFLLAFKRMINRRGTVKVMYSDNGTNFVRAAKDLQQIYEELRQSQPLLQPLEWKFSHALSPWEGGVWERLMRMVKDPLKRMLGNSTLTAVELETILTDVEAMLNDRPLMRLTENSEDFTALTPAHILVGRPLKANLIHFQGIQTPDHADLGTRWKHREHLTKQFWNRWTNSYLAMLQPRHKWFEAREYQKGDLVLVPENSKNRCVWPLGVIIDITKGRDNLVRSIRLKTTGGKIIVRPVHKVCPLESSPLPPENRE